MQFRVVGVWFVIRVFYVWFVRDGDMFGMVYIWCLSSVYGWEYVWCVCIVYVQCICAVFVVHGLFVCYVHGVCVVWFWW